MIRVSVVVAAHDAEHGIGDLVECIAGQTLSHDEFELLVVDDASRDRTADAAAQGGVATVIRATRRGGAYAARNLALARASGQVIAITDADCRPHPDWLERGLEEVAALGAGIAGGHVDVPLSGQPTLAELIDYGGSLDQRRCIEEWGFAATANAFVTRDVFDAVGTFNEALVSGGDLELSARATAAGFALRYAPGAVVTHLPRTRARQVARKSFRVGYGLGQIRRHGAPEARNRPRIWSDPRSWRPRRGLLGIERVRAAGHHPSRTRLIALDVAQYALRQVPMAAGNLAASLRSRPR